jgi:hypothetical protein
MADGTLLAAYRIHWRIKNRARGHIARRVRDLYLQWKRIVCWLLNKRRARRQEAASVTAVGAVPEAKHLFAPTF